MVVYEAEQMTQVLEASSNISHQRTAKEILKPCLDVLADMAINDLLI